MRLTSTFWIAALTRRAYAEGAVAAIVRKGAEEAGAIFIIVDRLDGTADLYGPAPQSILAEDRSDDRLFQKVMERGGSEEIAARVERERKFDPDLWVVAVEDRAARTFFATI